MKRKAKWTQDPDLLASEAALRRAAKTALRIGLETGTPVYVLEHGRIIDLTKEHKHCKRAPRGRIAGKSRRSAR